MISFKGSEEGMDVHSGCETMESEYCSGDNDEKENDPDSTKVKKVKHKRKKRVKRSQLQSQVMLFVWLANNLEIWVIFPQVISLINLTSYTLHLSDTEIAGGK